MNGCFNKCSNLTIPPNTPQGVTHMGDCYKECVSLIEAPKIPVSVIAINGLIGECNKITSITLPLTTWANYNYPFNGCTQLTDITWSGKRTANLDLNILGAPSYTQEDIQELVPEHLEDLYKDTIKISFSDNKITVNDTETTITT